MSDFKIEDTRILIVDDQNEIRSLMRMMLMEIGMTQIFDAKDGREALTFMDEAPDLVDLVICDWDMPNLTGVELLRQMRSVYADLPFLMVTGRVDMDSVVEAKESGVNGYIGKPFSPVELETKIRVVMERALKAA